MKKNYIEKWSTRLLVVLTLLTTSFSFSQVDVIATGGTLSATYPTIAASVTAINSGTHTGSITVNIVAGHSETAPVGGIILTATGTLSNQIIFQKNGAGANPLINAYAGGTGTPGTAVQDAIFKFVGSDYVTIDRLDLNDPNGANPATMEDGYVFYKASATDGCQFNTIQNCTITLNRTNNATGVTPQFDGSIGIFFSNAIPTAATTPLTVTAVTGSNRFNRVYSNTIQNVNIGIGFSGFGATIGVGPAPVAATFLGDLNNDAGGTSLATGNTVLNYGGAAAATNPAAGIRNSNQWSFNASFNTITNNNGSGVNHVSTLRGILIGGATSANLDVLNNVITLTSGATTSLVEGISSSAGTAALLNTVNINNNTVRIAYTTATTGSVNGIISTAIATNLIANGNVLTSNVGAALPINNTISGTGTVLWMTFGSPNNITANNNTISNIARTSAAGGIMRGIVIASPTNTTIDGNLIENIAYSTPTSTGGFDGIYGFTSSVNVTYTNNIVRNISTPSTGLIRGLVEFGVTGNKNISNNQVYGFSTTSGGVGGASFIGILSSTGVVTISNNQVYGLTSVGTSGGTVGAITGISLTGGTSSLISRNKIYNLSTLATGATPVINGITVSGGATNTVENNYIGDLKSTSTGAGMSGLSSINGVNISAGTTANLYYNTIYLNATSTSTTTFGTSAVFLNSTTTNLDLRNNNIVNLSIPAQDVLNVSTNGISAGLRRSSGTGGTVPANYSTSSNNNNIWVNSAAGTNNRSAYVEGTATITNNMNTVSAMKTFMVNRDQVSVSENPTFLNTATPVALDWLHLNNVTPTLLESGANNISGITTDYDNDIRQGNVGYSGTGSNPDIGADEFNGTTPAPVITTITVLPAGNACVNASRGVGATITTSIPNTITSAQINYSINGTAQAAIPMTFFGLDIYTGTIPTVIPTNATVVWSISATNSIGISSTSGSQSYTDEPLTGVNGTATASLTTVCAGSPSSLSATLALSGAGPVGTPGVASANFPDVPLNHAYGGAKTQYIYRASELIAAGFSAGNITNLSYNVTAIGTTPLNAFTIDMGNTAQNTAVTNVAITSGLTNVYTNAAQPVTLGTNNFLLSTPFSWDGTSNIVVSFVYSNNNAGGTSSTLTSSTASFVSTMGIRADNTTATCLYGAVASTDACVNLTNTNATSSIRPLITFTGNRAPAITSVTWMNGVTTVGTGNPLIVNPVTTTTYTANITAAGCVLSPSPTVMVNVNPVNVALTPINISCNGLSDGSFSLGTVTCGVAPFTYSVDAGAFGSIPTNLTLGAHTIIVKDAGGFDSAPIMITITQPLSVGTPVIPTNASICQNDGSALINATNSGSIVLTIPLSAAGDESNVVPGNVIGSSTYTALPAGATVTSATITVNGLIPNGGDYQTDVKLGFSGSINDPATLASSGTSLLGAGTVSGVPYNYTRPIPVGTINTAGGAFNVLYWNDFEDVAGAEDATFPATATVTINYSGSGAFSSLSWWTAASAGTNLGTTSPFETVGTTVLPTTSTPGTYTFYAQGQNGVCASATRLPVTVTVNALPVVNAGADQTVCEGSAVTLNGTVSGGTWSGPVAVTNGTAFTPPAGVHTFIYTVTNVSGCTDADTVIVTVNTNPVSNAGADQTVCEGTAVTLNGTVLGGTWTGPVAVTNGTAFTPPAGVHTFIYTVTNVAGCSDADTVIVSVNTLPAATASYSGDSILTASAGSTYQWIDCATNTAIAGATSQTFQATANGSYAVVVTNATGCSDTSTCVTVADLSVDSKEFTFINVYPNPTNGSVTVTMNAEFASIELVDAQGKVIAVSTVNNGGIVDLTSVERGVYFLRVKTEKGQTTQRVVKQ